MFEKKVWNDRQSEHPARRRLTPAENDNEYEVSRAEGLVMEEGDAFDATTMNDLENRVAKAFAEYDPAELGAVNVTVQLYTCKKEGKVYQLTGSGAVGRCKIPAAWASGDTWKVNGTAVPAYCGADAVDGDTIVAGRWAIFTFDVDRLGSVHVDQLQIVLKADEVGHLPLGGGKIVGVDFPLIHRHHPGSSARS